MESLLCHLNSHMKKQGPIKSEVTKVFSLAASFAWTMEQEIEDGNKIWKYGGNPDMDRWQLYKSIWNGKFLFFKIIAKFFLIFVFLGFF